MTGSSSCGACKFLRRKCASNCVFAPHFSYEDGASHFAAVHRVFGASNVSKLLSHVPTDSRGEAAATVAYEALARMRNPVYGCVGHVYALQHQVASLQEEIEVIGNQMALTFNNYPTDGLQLCESREQNHARPFTLGAANVHNNNNNVALNSQTNLQIPLVEGRMNPTHVWDSDLAMIPLLGIHDETTEFPMHYSWLNNSSSNRSSI